MGLIESMDAPSRINRAIVGRLSGDLSQDHNLALGSILALCRDVPAEVDGFAERLATELEEAEDPVDALRDGGIELADLKHHIIQEIEDAVAGLKSLGAEIARRRG